MHKMQLPEFFLTFSLQLRKTIYNSPRLLPRPIFLFNFFTKMKESCWRFSSEKISNFFFTEITEFSNKYSLSQSASLSTISGPFSLYFQSSFHSITVLVCYRSLRRYLALQRIYFALCARLQTCTTLKIFFHNFSTLLLVVYRAFTFSGVVFQQTFTKYRKIEKKKNIFMKLQFAVFWSLRFTIWALSSSLAATREISFDFFYLRLVICLNSASSLVSLEVQFFFCFFFW